MYRMPFLRATWGRFNMRLLLHFYLKKLFLCKYKSFVCLGVNDKKRTFIFIFTNFIFKSRTEPIEFKSIILFNVYLFDRLYKRYKNATALV